MQAGFSIRVIEKYLPSPIRPGILFAPKISAKNLTLKLKPSPISHMSRIFGGILVALVDFLPPLVDDQPLRGPRAQYEVGGGLNSGVT